jgi:polar amino acid transport system permease protein
MPYEWDFGIVLRHPEWLVRGLLGTLWLTLASLAFALPLGLVVAVLRLSRRRALALPAALFVDLLRNTPSLVLFFWTFFALPLLAGIKLDPFGAGVIALSLQYSALFGEIFRGGILSVERGQWEGARSIGMTYWPIMRWVVLPQAVRRMLPAFFSHIIDLVKTTSLAASISYADLLYEAARVSADTYRPIETFTVAAAVYFVVLFTASRLVERVELRLAVADRR